MKVKAGKKIKIWTQVGFKAKTILSLLGTFIIIVGVTYGFMTLCYWNPNLQEWGGFGRFLLGAEGVIFLIKLLEEI